MNIQFLTHVVRGSHDQTAHHYSYIVHFSRQCWLTAYHSHLESQISGFLNFTALICRLTLDLTCPFDIIGWCFQYLRRQGHTRLHSLSLFMIEEISEKSYPSVKRLFLHRQGVVGSRGDGWLVVLLFYVHGKHLRSCRDGQLT